jgi:hypothetical protein
MIPTFHERNAKSFVLLLNDVRTVSQEVFERDRAFQERLQDGGLVEDASQ